MGQVLSRALGFFVDFGVRRLAAIAVLALGTIPALYAVAPQYRSARQAFATAGNLDASPNLTPTADFVGAAAEAASEARTAAPVADESSAVRPLYPYSVVPGGIRTAAEIRTATSNDPTVRIHYAGLNISNARLERLDAPKLAYVSYRRGDNIFWTRKPVLVAAGEHVMTDGSMMLRARCGNRLSETPMAPVEAPTAAVPAEAMELPPADAMAVPAAMPEGVPLAPIALPQTAILLPEAGPTPGSPTVAVGYGPPLAWVPTGGGTTTSGPTGPGAPGGPGTSGPGAPSGPGSPSGGSPGSGGPTPPSGPGAPSGPGTPGTPPIPAPEPGEIAMLAVGIATLATIAALRKMRAA